MIAPASTERNEIDLKNGVQFFPVQHIGTFQGLASTMANTYRDYDIALRDSLDNARFMRNDCGVMMALESRLRAVALFPWHIEPENEHSPEQKQLCEEMTKIMDRIPRFVEFRKCLLEAIWFGKYGVQVKYGHDWIGGYRRLTIKSNDGDDCPAWLPVNGDKIVFRHDDASRYENKSGAYPFQVGIRVGVNYKPGEKIMGKYVAEPISQSYRGSEPIDRGMAYFLDRNDRQLLVIHKHMIEDGSYEDILSAGSIHGIGIRSRIYWDWVQCRETLGFLIAYLERTHGGIEIYRYPMGNMEAKREVERLITNREPGRGALMVPIPMGEDASQYGVEVTESGMGGIQQMLDLIENYYSTRITKYILGQELSSSAKATGLGSGVADLHLESLLQVLNYDATNLEETMTTQSLRRLQVSNFPASKGINLKFKIDTEDKNQAERLNAINQAFQMGARIKESDVFDVVGLSAPGPNDRVLQAPGGGDGQPSGDPGPMPPSRNSVSVPDDIADMPQRYMNTWSEADHPRDSDGEFRSKSASALLKKYTEHNPWSSVKNGVSRSVWYAGAVKGEDGVTRATPYEAKLRTMSDNYINFNTDDPVENWLLAIDEETGSPPVEFTFEVVRDVDNPFGVTGMGSAREVIGKATDYLRHAIYAWSSSVFYFTAAERSRKVLYERLAKFGNEAKSWDGHEYAAYRIDGLGDSHTTFVIAKRDVDIEAITKDYAGESAVVTRLGGDVNRYALSDLTPERYSYAAREPDLRSAIDRAANATDPNPSDAQKVTGNYRKGQFHWNGWTIAIETPAGAKRRGRNALGLEWENTIPVHYGYFRRTESEADGDHIDVFVGPEPESQIVFVIDQVKGNGHFDEHKVMIGFTSEKDAIDAYRGSYSPGWTGLRSIHGLTVPQFKAWMDEGDSGDPISGQVSKYARQIEFEWNESDHPRDDAGRFAEAESTGTAKKSLKPGMVEMRQAKAGGETSEVDGKFYKGGQWLPVHGLYAGQEKPEKAEKPPEVEHDPFAHLASENGGKGRPVARERSREEVDRERQRMQEERDWQVVAGGPLGRALNLGERPHGIRHTHGSLPAWTELARSGEVSDDKFDSVSEWAEQQSRKAHDEKERPLGGPGYDPGRKWGAEPVSDADWAWEQSQVADAAKGDIEWVSRRNDRKILKQHPQVALARAWVSHLLQNDQSIETLTTLHRLMTGSEGGGTDQEPGEPEKYAMDWKEEQHPRDNDGKFTDQYHDIEGGESKMSKMVLWRASNDDHISDSASFAESKESAVMYLNNPGFGGGKLFKTEVDVGEYLDLTGDDAMDVIREALDTDHDYGAIGVDELVPRVASELADAGIQWVKVNESFPEETTTWIYVGGSLGEEPELMEVDDD